MNVLARWILGDAADPVSDADAHDALAELAQRANRALRAGVTAERVDAGWDTRAVRAVVMRVAVGPCITCGTPLAIGSPDANAPLVDLADGGEHTPDMCAVAITFAKHGRVVPD